MNDIMTAQEHLDKAHQYESEGKYDEALDECDLAILANPDFAEAYNTRGILLEQLGALDSAVANYEMAVELDPDSEVALQNLYDAQNEAVYVKRQRILGTIILAAFGYGLSLMLFRILNILINGPFEQVSPEGFVFIGSRFGSFPSAIIEAVLVTAGIGLGTYIFASALGIPMRERLVLYVIGGCGTLFLSVSLFRIINDYLGFHLFGVFSPLRPILFVLQYALPGAMVGAFVANSLSRAKNWTIPAFAGLVLGVVEMNSDFISNIATWASTVIRLRWFRAGSDIRYYAVVYHGVNGLLGGLIFGIVLVLALFFAGYIYQTTLPITDEHFLELEEEE